MSEEGFIPITETKEFKEELEKFIENTTLKEFLNNSNRGFGKTGLRNHIMLKLMEKEEKKK